MKRVRTPECGRAPVRRSLVMARSPFRRAKPAENAREASKTPSSCANHISTKRAARALKFCRVVDLSMKNNLSKFQVSSCNR